MLFDTNGQQVTGLASSVDDMMLCGNAEVDGQPSDKLTPYFTRKVSLTFPVPNARLWSAETPYLYTLVLRTSVLACRQRSGRRVVFWTCGLTLKRASGSSRC